MLLSMGKCTGRLK